MRPFAKFLTLAFTFIFLSTQAQAISKKNDIDKAIKASPLNNEATIAVSVKRLSGGEVYGYNSSKLLHPASVLKLLTTPANLNTLGSEYKFKTLFYKTPDNNLYIKLGADPLLTTEQLRTALESIKLSDVKNVYIDDKITDRYEWGIGWMWDDDTNSRMPKISPYNIDGNIINITIKPTEMGEIANVSADNATAATIINMTKTSDKTDVHAYRQNYISPNVVYVFGTVSKPTTVCIPESNPELRFKNTLVQILKDENIFAPNISQNLFPQNVKPTYKIENDIKPAINEILKNSNNFYAESIFKIAGGEKAKAQGTFTNAEKMFTDYYTKLGLAPSKVIIADGSGVSRNNLFSADWITSALIAIKKDKNFELIKKSMAQGGTGTLTNRLNNIGAKVYAKTGTLANLSSIAGYVTAQNGQEYVFSITISNYNSEDKCAKELEDKIIKLIYDLK